ncbi:MAG: hypothetical protein OET44_15360 [Gammaproteobacteria bacterium]|nr:hypothetical protein [Gammaproteobacteria bacterium]
MLRPGAATAADNLHAVLGDPTLDFCRISMNKPMGKCNVYNEITHSAGTSH